AASRGGGGARGWRRRGGGVVWWRPPPPGGGGAGGRGELGASPPGWTARGGGRGGGGSACPITPPCVNAATRWPACAPSSLPIAARTRPSKETRDSAPGITSQRSSANMRLAIGWFSATILRYSPPSHSPRLASPRSDSNT